MDHLPTTRAAVLTTQGLNVGWASVVSADVAALTWGRISHVYQHYVRAETHAAANAWLIDGQAEAGRGRLLGRGLVAAVDGTRLPRCTAGGLGLRRDADAAARRQPDAARAGPGPFRPVLRDPACLSYVDTGSYRRAIKRMRNLQEGRHGRGRYVFHGRAESCWSPITRHGGPARRSRAGDQLGHFMEHCLSGRDKAT